jgi:competence protein ComEA
MFPSLRALTSSSRKVSTFKIARGVLALSVASWLCVTYTRAQQPSPPPSASPQAPEDPNLAVVRRVCAACHPIDRIVGLRKGQFEWEETINTMLAKGAKGTDDELSAVMDYLMRNVGRVNVNRAPAPEIEWVLSLSTEAATSVVQYRKDHGAFADFDALLKVPGLDGQKLTAKRDAVQF